MRPPRLRIKVKFTSEGIPLLKLIIPAQDHLWGLFPSRTIAIGRLDIQSFSEICSCWERLIREGKIG